jgi:CRISPR-associated protein Cas2
VVRGQESVTLVIYDVEDDRARARIAKVCKDYGLEHVQYSAFRGPLSATLRKEMFARLRDVLGERPGRILVAPLCEKDVEGRLEVGRAP